MIEFTVLGQPATAGSKRGIPYEKKGKFKANGKPELGVRVIHDNERFESWSQACKQEALRAAAGRFIDGPILLMVQIIRPRPKGHFRTGKNSLQVRDAAPGYPDTKPDLTKVVRAIEDSLTGVIWRDDCQVVRQVTAKDWGEPERVEVTVAEWPTVAEDAASLGFVLGMRAAGVIEKDS